MTLVEIQGDLFTSNAEVLVNGVNCRGLAGAGIALAFRSKYPGAYDKYNDDDRVPPATPLFYSHKSRFASMVLVLMVNHL